MSSAEKESQKKYVYSAVNQKVKNEDTALKEFSEEYVDTGPTFGRHHVQIGLLFMLGFVAFTFRVSLSVGIVAMTDPSINTNPDIPTYPQWKRKIVILSSFFWGYVVSQIFAEWISKKYGAKWFLVGAMSMQSILSLLTPLTADKFGEEGIMVSRAVEGLCQVFPVSTHLLSCWVAPQERSRFGSVIFTSPLFGKRHVQVALCFFLGFIAFAFRVNLSVAIVAMMDPKVSSNPDVPTYAHWTKKNMILSSFSWGYVLLPVPAAWVSQKYGPKWFLVGAIGIQSVLGTLTPFIVASFGETGIMTSRTIEGICQGFIFPCSTQYLSHWVPPQERSRFGSVMFTASKLGTLCSIYLTGLVAAGPYGWPWAYKGLGFIGLLWCTLMAIFGYDTPRDHPRITQAERLFIETSLDHDDKHYKTPWKAIFTSIPVWALFTAHSGQNYAFYLLFMQMPSYLNQVMKFDMKDNGLWSAMPYLAMFVLSYVFAFSCDALINKGVMSRTAARKTFNSIGFFIPAVALIVLGYTNSDQAIQAVTIGILAVGISSACYTGFGVNYMDLSPNHAGMIIGLINQLGQLTAIIAPLSVQLFVTNEADPTQWRPVFLIAAGTYIIPGVLFILFGSGKVQWWNKVEDEVNKE